MTSVRLEPITQDNVKAVFDLEVAPEQLTFVAPNPWSLAQALAYHGTAWPRAIVAGDEVVGFVMLHIDPEPEDGRSYYLWRLMIGADHQRRGHGTAAIELVIDEVRDRGATELFVSWVPGEGSPEPLYLGLGFVPTGELDGDEIVARLSLEPEATGSWAPRARARRR